MSFFVPGRRPQLELLDRGDLPPEEIEKSLADSRFVNRFWGGHRTAEAAALRLLEAGDARSVSLLDIGSGTADVSLAVARRAGRAGISVRVVALDRQVTHLSAARPVSGPRAPALVARDALALPLGGRSFHWGFSSLFPYHPCPA